jgi:hypothetical protein
MNKITMNFILEPIPGNGVQNEEERLSKLIFELAREIPHYGLNYVLAEPGENYTWKDTHQYNSYGGLKRDCIRENKKYLDSLLSIIFKNELDFQKFTAKRDVINRLKQIAKRFNIIMEFEDGTKMEVSLE